MCTGARLSRFWLVGVGGIGGGTGGGTGFFAGIDTEPVPGLARYVRIRFELNRLLFFPRELNVLSFGFIGLVYFSKKVFN